MKTLVGSLLWISQATRPDLAPVVSLLASHQSNPGNGHIKAAKHVIKYLKHTKDKGITFSHKPDSRIQAFLQFPTPKNTILPLTDANWGAQDQSIPNPNTPIELERFVTRSISGLILLLNGPIHWSSRRQKITARSSAESEIYATDECTKCLLRIKHMAHDLNISDKLFANTPVTVYNDNSACVHWSKNTTSKGLRHITIRENAIRESIDNKFIKVEHIRGSINIADLFTKELADTSRFKQLRDLVVQSIPSINSPISLVQEEGGIGLHVEG